MIPSYDDLTPGIPDVPQAETVSQLALFLRDDLKGVGAVREPSMDREVRRNAVNETIGAVHPSSLSAPATLYACLRYTEPRTTTDARPTLLAVARDFSPRVMVASEREVLLDVSGLGRLIGEPPAIAAAITRALAEVGLAAAGVALAPTRTAARLLAAQRPGYPISRLPEIPVSCLAPLEILPPAINHRDRARPYETFERWGIATLGDLAALPAADLSSRLGRRGVALQRLARGHDARPFVPAADTPRYIGRLELEWPIEALEPLSFVLARLLEPLAVALERADRGAAAIRLELRLTTRATHARVLQLPAAMRDPRVLRTLLLLDLESHPPAPLSGFGGTAPASAGIDVVTIELDPAPARITQCSLLERAVPSPETLSTLAARLSALVGESRIGSPRLLDTHRPGAFVMERYAPETRGAEGTHAAHGATGAGAEGAVLRRQRVPPAIRVAVERGRPVHVAAARRGMPQGAVTQAAGPWRTSGGWWTRSGAGGQGPEHGAEEDPCRAEGGLVPPTPRSDREGGWNRDEWDVALDSGVVCRIFQDRITERWFLDGLYD